MDKVSLYKRREIFWVRFTLNGRQVRESLNTSNRKVAEDLRAEKEFLFRRGDLREKVPVPVKAFLEKYFEYCRIQKAYKTWNSDKGRINHFVQASGVTDLTQVTTRQVSDYIFSKTKQNGEPASNTYRLRIREALHAMFEWGIEQGYFEDNPVSKVRRPVPEERPIRFLDKKQIKKMLEAVKGRLIEPFACTALYAGMRRGEIAWLTWDDLYLKGVKPVIKVRTKVVNGVKWTPKTKTNRVIPISPKLLRTLKRINRNGQPWVFLGPGGTKWGEDWATDQFGRAMKDAGLDWTLLDLRHTFASHLAQKGRSLYKISKFMGNSPEICEGHYAALVPEDMHEDVAF